MPRGSRHYTAGFYPNEAQILTLFFELYDFNVQDRNQLQFNIDLTLLTYEEKKTNLHEQN